MFSQSQPSQSEPLLNLTKIKTAPTLPIPPPPSFKITYAFPAQILSRITKSDTTEHFPTPETHLSFQPSESWKTDSEKTSSMNENEYCLMEPSSGRMNISSTQKDELNQIKDATSVHDSNPKITKIKINNINSEYKSKDEEYSMVDKTSSKVVNKYYNTMESSSQPTEDYCVMDATKKNKDFKFWKNSDEYCLMEKRLSLNNNTKYSSQDQEYSGPNQLSLSGAQTNKPTPKWGLMLFSVKSAPSQQSNLSPESPKPTKQTAGEDAGFQFEYSHSESPSRSNLENRRVSFSPEICPNSRSQVDLQVAY